MNYTTIVAEKSFKLSEKEKKFLANSNKEIFGKNPIILGLRNRGILIHKGGKPGYHVLNPEYKSLIKKLTKDYIIEQDDETKKSIKTLNTKISPIKKRLAELKKVKAVKEYISLSSKLKKFLAEKDFIL